MGVVVGEGGSMVIRALGGWMRRMRQGRSGDRQSRQKGKVMGRANIYE